jgi:hypothetical protein
MADSVDAGSMAQRNAPMAPRSAYLPKEEEKVKTREGAETSATVGQAVLERGLAKTNPRVLGCTGHAVYDVTSRGVAFDRPDFGGTEGRSNFISHREPLTPRRFVQRPPVHGRLSNDA